MRLQLYVLRLLAVSFTFSVAGICFLVFPAITVNAVQTLKGAGIQHLIDFMPLVAIELVPYLLPLAFLLAVVATFGRLAADNEWTAIRLAGIHPGRLLVPCFMLAAALAWVTGEVAHEISPDWKFRKRAFSRLVSNSAMSSLSPGRTEINIGDFYLHAARRKDNTFYDVLLFVPRMSDDDEESTNPDDVEFVNTKVVADVAKFDVRDGILYVDFVNPRSVTGSDSVKVDFTGFNIPLDDFLKVREKKRAAAKFWPTSQLLEAERNNALPWSGEPFAEKERREFQYEIQRRTALSVTYVLFLLLGLPTGIWLRRGSQLSAFAVAVGYAFLYYVLSLRIGKELAYMGKLQPWMGAWSVNAVGAAIGTVLTWRVIHR